MLAGEAAAHLDACRQNLAASFDRVPHLAGLALIIQHDRMDVAVARVKDVSDRKTMALADRIDDAQDIRQPRARYDAILGGVIRREPADGSESPFARFPQ